MIITHMYTSFYFFDYFLKLLRQDQFSSLDDGLIRRVMPKRTWKMKMVMSRSWWRMRMMEERVAGAAYFENKAVVVDFELAISAALRAAFPNFR